jgi:uncharacterized peroxidase-related enzyme
MARAAWFFAVPADDALPDQLRGLFAKARERIGFVPNVFRSYSIRPERFSAWFAHFKLLHEPTENLDEADREMIAVVVSAYNRCTYCVVAHGQALRAAFAARGMTAEAAEVLADHLATNWRHADVDARQRAICDYAERLTAEPRLMQESDLRALRDVGLSDHEVWDVAEIASMYNFTNRMALALGQQPNEEYHHLDRPT